MIRRPSSPLATSAAIFTFGPSSPCEWPTSRRTPLRWAAAIIASQSASVSAIGLSAMTCFPRSAAMIACRACQRFGVST